MLSPWFRKLFFPHRSSLPGRTPARPAKRATTTRRRPTLECLEDRTVLSNTTWTGLGLNNNWSNPANWSGGVPGAGDTAIFSSHPGGSSTAVVDAAFSVVLSIDANWGGTIQVNQPVTTTGSGQWASGTMIVADGVSWSNTGTLTLNGTADRTLFGTLTNAGTMIQTAPSGSANRLLFGAPFVSGVLNNSGLYDLQENGTSALNNSGTFQKSQGTGSSDNGTVPFSNTGTVIA